MMPILFIFSLAVQIICCMHVIKTGRNQTWIWFIIIAPGLGSFIYFIMEMLPSLMGSRTVHNAKRTATNVLDPTREYRSAKDDLDYINTVENRLRFAAAAVGIGNYGEAATTYKSCLEGHFETDPNIRLKLATTHYLDGNYGEALSQLDLLQKQNNGFQSQEGHLIYAQSLEKLGRYDEALECYDGLIVYSLGEEAPCRYAMLLKNMGQSEKAGALFDTIIKSIDHNPKHYQKTQAEWYRIAKLNT